MHLTRLRHPLPQAGEGVQLTRPLSSRWRRCHRVLAVDHPFVQKLRREIEAVGPDDSIFESLVLDEIRASAVRAENPARARSPQRAKGLAYRETRRQACR